ncbi:hypothetical protein IT072_15415 [Leifsonia sp. ZF2019]|uniref:hypothetical protein n=1 Tax=Leifsonia sp. ZF2019 TaxID=2781978 RepID=UPI001CBB1C61|nr:hypothetical protein [Leifsonia sp. ZF2019]UAJ78617.1 hypothetical protein IT072_15415 [Leifsonia sp. ZF2019]
MADVEAAAEAGGYEFAFSAAATGAMTPADGSSARTDILYVQIDDPAEGDSSTTPAVTRKYLAGVAGSGVAPTPPVARAFVIAQINVPKSGSGAPSVTWVAPYTAAAGGVVPFNNATEMNNWTPPLLGQLAQIGLDFYKYVGTGWQVAFPFAEAAGFTDALATTGVAPQATANVTVTFPTNRFTQAPIPDVTTSSGRFTGVVTAVSTTQMTIQVQNNSGAAGLPGRIYWGAKQMFAGSAAG